MRVVCGQTYLDSLPLFLLTNVWRCPKKFRQVQNLRFLVTVSWNSKIRQTGVGTPHVVFVVFGRVFEALWIVHSTDCSADLNEHFVRIFQLNWTNLAELNRCVYVYVCVCVCGVRALYILPQNQREPVQMPATGGSSSRKFLRYHVPTLQSSAPAAGALCRDHPLT
jgi:hypothetical protein